MLIIPAIDLLDNVAVRLYKGDYSQKTVYNQEPWTLVQAFSNHGAELIHIVDLNAARDESDINKETIKKIRETSKVKLELGGGIRDLDKLKYYDSLGIDRFIIGTSAVTNPEFVDDALKSVGDDRLVVGVDARDGYVKISGWETDSKILYVDFLTRLEKQGVRHIIYTDIALDGTLSGPNIESYKTILNLFEFQLIASGGISSIKDIISLFSLKEKRNLFGIITGKAIYEGKLDLQEAIEQTKSF